MATGWDYSHFRPNKAQLAASGVSFVIRYLLPASMGTSSPAKGLSLSEATQLSGAGGWGMFLVANYEFDPAGMANGAVQGATDAKIALAELIACQVPANTVPPRPVYFSADWPVNQSEVPAVLAYLRAAAAILRPAGYDVGIYGSEMICAAVLDAGFKWAWQTIAWSGTPTVWEPRAQIRQIAVGNQYDTNESTVADFGQWTVGNVLPVPPSPPVSGLTVQQIWETPINVPGYGTYSPLNLLVEIYERTAGRGVLAAMYAGIKEIMANTAKAATDPTTSLTAIYDDVVLEDIANRIIEIMKKKGAIPAGL
jgi:hypothetical protein